MSNALGMNTPLAEGFYGFPVAQPQAHGPARGTIEWLLQTVERHAAAEQDALAEYEFVAEASADPVVALVMRLILEDEERHHGLLRRIEVTLRDALNWTHSPSALPEPALPQQPIARVLVTINACARSGGANGSADDARYGPARKGHRRRTG